MNRFLALTLCASLASLAGCSNSTGLPPGETGTVSGKVTYMGKPIPQGSTVIFREAKSGILGTGVTDASGGYKLQMQKGNKILCGSYRVAIAPPAVSLGISDEEAAKLAMENKLPKPPEVKEIPQAYRSPETTPGKADVKPGDNVVDLDLKD